jgi:hypothetical protein
MKLYPKNTLFGLHYKQWTYLEAFAYCLKGIMKERPFFLNYYKKVASKAFVKKWLKHDERNHILISMVSNCLMSQIAGKKSIY